MEGIIKEFFNWTKRKIFHHLNKVSEKQVFYREKEIWWAALGQNIGHELNGKSETYERPVLIIKKYNPNFCFILPLTTQVKKPIPWYQIPVYVNYKNAAVNLTQGRSISVKRLLKKEDTLSNEKYLEVVKAFGKQF